MEFQPRSDGSDLAQQPTDLGIWLELQPKFARCHAAQSLQTLTFRGGFQQGLEGVTMPSSLEDLTLAQLEVGRCLTSGFAEILWLWAQR